MRAVALGMTLFGYDMVAIMEKWSGLKMGLLAGSLGIAALAPFATGADIPFDSPGVIKMHEEMKDKGMYYSYSTTLKLRKMDVFWLKDKSLEDSDDLPPPDELAQEIADDLQTAWEQFASIAEKVKG